MMKKSKQDKNKISIHFGMRIACHAQSFHILNIFGITKKEDKKKFETQKLPAIEEKYKPACSYNSVAPLQSALHLVSVSFVLCECE